MGSRGSSQRTTFNQILEELLDINRVKRNRKSFLARGDRPHAGSGVKKRGISSSNRKSCA